MNPDKPITTAMDCDPITPTQSAFSPCVPLDSPVSPLAPNTPPRSPSHYPPSPTSPYESQTPPSDFPVPQVEDEKSHRFIEDVMILKFLSSHEKVSYFPICEANDFVDQIKQAEGYSAIEKLCLIGVFTIMNEQCKAYSTKCRAVSSELHPRTLVKEDQVCEYLADIGFPVEDCIAIADKVKNTEAYVPVYMYEEEITFKSEYVQLLDANTEPFVRMEIRFKVETVERMFQALLSLFKVTHFILQPTATRIRYNCQTCVTDLKGSLVKITMKEPLGQFSAKKAIECDFKKPVFDLGGFYLFTLHGKSVTKTIYDKCTDELSRICLSSKQHGIFEYELESLSSNGVYVMMNTLEDLQRRNVISNTFEEENDRYDYNHQ